VAGDDVAEDREAKPVAAVDIRDVQVIKEDRTFFISDPYGDVPLGNRSALGLYHMDTRFLSRLDLVFTQTDGVTAAHVPRKEGDLEILIRQ
jgi:hypothetical protein